MHGVLIAKIQRQTIIISPGSVATCLRCGGHRTANLLPIVSAKEVLRENRSMFDSAVTETCGIVK